MKKLFLLGAALLLVAGCSAEFYKRDTLFKTRAHAAYSWWGYKNTTADHAKMSAEQGWWGKEVPYTPAK